MPASSSGAQPRGDRLPQDLDRRAQRPSRSGRRARLGSAAVRGRYRAPRACDRPSLRPSFTRWISARNAPLCAAPFRHRVAPSAAATRRSCRSADPRYVLDDLVVDVLAAERIVATRLADLLESARCAAPPPRRMFRRRSHRRPRAGPRRHRAPEPERRRDRLGISLGTGSPARPPPR